MTGSARPTLGRQCYATATIDCNGNNVDDSRSVDHTTIAGEDPSQTEPSGVQTFSISGLLKSLDGNAFVFEGMTLPKSSGLSLPEGVSEGSTVDLVFTIAEDGTVILTDILAP